ncbi:peptidylprolyl isomerase [Shewanella sp. Choline-02u-19]|jgi:FKBP-type peptidyl-prolyl cis-trans isomerase FklB|uniref:FKBP-type peptidyl-prolyl cis-trans isomerase n=1 Tax=unclassified Shewanella TaxID=196818 RepID=UPI000C321513|nr:MULTISPECIES: FKBP-type peptidyl-prolyl cis-trans isomerase [unclassified Shewanella]PKG55053.1 peptidylprolyl isomerase [Shewanella sp. GutDb-MelDb]PKG75120.1 peptidylprolyl isomerase [Shewanella sp. GutCb]PKH58487.1 peptidylprolyl isomerase [Shewanella sp. Bg11-22]PKI26560.1 peptidylprolyl isomerase [Shewanella sp. Choline-02u-19]
MSDKFSTIEEQASYGVGRQLGEQLAANSFEGIDISAAQLGLSDAFEGKESIVDMQDMQVAFTEISQRIQKVQEAAAAAASEEGDKYLVDNAARDGILTTESGLQYEIIAEGNGDKPDYDSTVRVHYHGTFISGNIFDSSVARGEPAEFPVSGVIAGWTEALQLMPVGSKWKLFVPHHLAYGERGAGASIPPYSALVFEVELLDII